MNRKLRMRFVFGLSGTVSAWESVVEAQRSGIARPGSLPGDRPDFGNTSERITATKATSGAWRETPTPIGSTISIPVEFSGTTEAKEWCVYLLEIYSGVSLAAANGSTQLELAAQEKRAKETFSNSDRDLATEADYTGHRPPSPQS